MKVYLRNFNNEDSVLCFQHESLDACLEYALMLHRSVFEPHRVSVVRGVDESNVVTLELSRPVAPKHS